MTQSIHQQFSDFLKQGEIPLLDGLLLIAKDEVPSIDINEHKEMILSLAKGLHIPPNEEITQSIARLNIHFFSELQFTGDTEDYYHPQNSLLPFVVARKKGLPILLSCLYILIGREKGLPLHPISFPSHFLVGVSQPQFFIDTFHQGAIIKREQLREGLSKLPMSPKLRFDELITPVETRQILTRINNNLIKAFQKRAEPKGMLRAIERNLILVPEHTNAHHARYILLRGMGAYQQAAEALETFLHHHPDHPQAIELTQELSQLRGI